MDNFSWTNFGLGAVIIGLFFIPALWKVYNDLQKARELISDLQEKRVQDAKDVTSNVIQPMREFNQTGQSLIQAVTTHGQEK